MTPFMTGSLQVSEGRHPLEPFLADVNTGPSFLKGMSGARERGEILPWSMEAGWMVLCLSTTRHWNSARGRWSREQNTCFLLGRHFPSGIWEKVWEAGLGFILGASHLPFFILFWCPLGTQYPGLRGPQSFTATWAISSKKPWIQNQPLHHLQYLFSHWNGELTSALWLHPRMVMAKSLITHNASRGWLLFKG